MIRLPSFDDEDAKERAADHALMKGLHERDSDAIAGAIFAGAPYSHHVREFLANHFRDSKTTWKLEFKKRDGKGRPPSATHRKRKSLIFEEIHNTVPLVKDDECHLVLADGQFESFVSEVIDNLFNKHGVKVTRSEMTDLWAEYADQAGIKQRQNKARKPKSM